MHGNILIWMWFCSVVWVPDAALLAVDELSNGLTTLEQPDQTVKSLEDFVPEEWGLPPYGSEPDVD